MSKERLEELKKMRLLYEVCFVDEYASAIDDVTADFDLLIKRVQELEQDVREWEIVNESWEEINTVLGKQNKRYREAIEMALSDIDDYDFESVRLGLRKALEGEE